jgi:hypothetical protein
MPRQNFLARESFVDATEKQTREIILSIPDYLPHISLVAENKVIDSVRFVYEHTGKGVRYNVDLTVLPLNDQYTRISLHASHTNGHSFYEDPEMAFALHDFEGAIHAAIKGDLSLYYSKATIQKSSGGIKSLVEAVLPFFLKKKLS